MVSNNTDSLSYSSGGQMSEMGVAGLRSIWRPGGGAVFLSFPAFGGTRISWLMASSSSCQASNSQLSFCCILSLWFLSPTFKGACDCITPTQKIQGNIPTVKVIWLANLIPFATFPPLCYITQCIHRAQSGWGYLGGGGNDVTLPPASQHSRENCICKQTSHHKFLKTEGNNLK